MQPALRTATLATGVTLAYAEHGLPDGLPVVALHGITDSWHSFEPLMAHLPPSLRLLALSQRGHGDSERPAGGYRMRDLADDVAAFVDALHLPRVLLLGHSMGSVVAMRCAIDHPERVSGLMLAGATPSFVRNPAAMQFWREGVASLADPIDPAFARDFQVGTVAQPVPPELMERAVSESLKLPARVWHAAFDGLMTDDSAARIGTIGVPTLIAWGRHDAYCGRADQDALLSMIRGSELLSYDDAGHALHWEEPQRFARDLERFARRVAAPAAVPAAVA